MTRSSADDNTLAERGGVSLPADLHEPLRAWTVNVTLECSHPDSATRLAIGGAVLDLRDLERLLAWFADRYLPSSPNEHTGTGEEG